MNVSSRNNVAVAVAVVCVVCMLLSSHMLSAAGETTHLLSLIFSHLQLNFLKHKFKKKFSSTFVCIWKLHKNN